MMHTAFLFMNKVYQYKIVNELRKQTRVPYVVEYSVPGSYSVPKDFSLEGVPGLVFTTLLRRCQAYRLVTYWKDESFFDEFIRQSPDFPVPGSTLIWQGTQVSAMLPKSPWYISLQIRVGAVAAFLVALQVISSNYDVFLSKPTLAIELGKKTLQIVEHANFEELITIRNITHRYSNTALLHTLELNTIGTPSAWSDESQIQLVRKVSVPKFEIDFDPLNNLSKPLQVGVDDSIKITGEAFEPGRYTVEITAVADGGLLRRDARLEETIEVEVWPRIRVQVVGLVRNRCRNGKCTLAGKIWIGAKINGPIRISATMSDRDGVRFDKVLCKVCTKQGVYPAELTDPSETTGLTWVIPGGEVFEEIDFRVIVEYDPDKDITWSDLINRIKFDPIRGG